MPAGFHGVPQGYGQMPRVYEGMPVGSPINPMMSTPGYPQYPVGTAQTAPGMPGTAPYGLGGPTYGYPQMPGQGFPMGGHQIESSDLLTPTAGVQMPYMQQAPTQSLPTNSGGDCGCGGGGMQPAGMVSAPTPVQPSFVPPTPPIYSAPYTGPLNVAQPPYMNPYGLGPAGTNPYGMPGYRDESN
jgi:morphogenetic protein associated with SpoVID